MNRLSLRSATVLAAVAALLTACPGSEDPADPCAGVVCDDGNPCTDDSCDGGTCQHAENDIACDDGDACTTGDHCAAAACVGTAVLCPAPANDQCWGPSTCDPASGCQLHQLLAGTACDDGNACTTGDLCDADGLCVPTGDVTCVPPGDPECYVAVACDTGVGSCIFTAADAGTACSDDDACTAGESCDGAGACVASAAVSCDDGDPCTVDGCDSLAGCGHAQADDGTACSAGDACAAPGTCQAGTCVPGLPVNCDDGKPCTIDACDAASGCVHTPMTNGTACGVGDACSGAPYCQAGFCVQGPPVDCDDGDPCTVDACDGATGCVHSPAPDDTACSGGDFCSPPATCQAGLCTPGAPVNCDDGNACTADVCDAALSSCTSVPLPGQSCDDGDPCTLFDLCSAFGSCAGTPKSCDDGDPCTADFCSAITGTCSQVPLACGAYVCDPAGGCPSSCTSSAQCVPGYYCNGANQCVAKAPQGVACVANDACTTGWCVDGACCDTMCAGTCQACNLAGSVGTCRNIPAGSDPQNECFGATACNGAGACARFPPGVACGSDLECQSFLCVAGVCE